jgi:endoribonuclease Dicer
MLSDEEPVTSHQPEIDSDSDEEKIAIDQHGTSNLSEKRRAQKDLFKSFVHALALDLITKGDIAEELKAANDETLSITNLLHKQGNAVRIETPREYQMELFERAKKQNTIAVLDTGSGKTLIAVLLLRHILDEEIERRATGGTPRIAFFLVCLPKGT